MPRTERSTGKSADSASGNAFGMHWRRSASASAKSSVDVLTTASANSIVAFEQIATEFAAAARRAAHAASRTRWAVVLARVQFRKQLGERRHVVVAFDHRCDRTKPLDRVLVEIPHRIDDRLIVAVDDVVAVVAMPGQVDLLHAFARYRFDIGPARRSRD